MKNYNMLYEKAIQVSLVQNELYYRRMTPSIIYSLSTKASETLSKSFPNKAREYFVVYLQTASFHGLGHLVAPRRHPLEINNSINDYTFLSSIFWLVFLALSIFGSVYLSSTTLARYQHSPAVVSMDRDMFAWNTTFPAATVCPSPAIDQRLLKIYVRDSPEPNKKMLEQFIKALASSSYTTFESIPLYDGIPSDHFMDLILNISISFKPSLAVGDTGAILTMQPTITEMGLCYTVNSEVAIYNSPEYRGRNRWDTVTDSNVTTLLVHPLDGEVFLLISNMSSAFTGCIHGPLEVPDIANTKCFFALDGFYLKLYVTAFTVYTSAEAAKLSVPQRKCRFSHENNLKHNSIYSYNMCRMECRIRFALQHCECIPHFYRRIGDEKVCDVAGLHCLGRHKVELLTLKFSPTDPVTCDCLPICDDVNYVIQSNVNQKWWNNGSYFQWGINTYSRMRFRRDIIFGFSDLLVAVGSMAALFLGCSVLSFLEIIYFFTLRLFWYISGWR